MGASVPLVQQCHRLCGDNRPRLSSGAKLRSGLWQEKCRASLDWTIKAVFPTQSVVVPHDRDGRAHISLTITRMPAWLDQLNSEVVSCTRCPRLVEFRERIARVKRRAYLTLGLLGEARSRLWRSQREGARAWSRARSPRLQSHRAPFHRRCLGKIHVSNSV